MMARMKKIQTRKWAWYSAWTPSRMKVIRATPVTP